MVISIKNPEARHLAKELAQMLGVTMTEAIKISLREKLEIIEGQKILSKTSDKDRV